MEFIEKEASKEEIKPSFLKGEVIPFIKDVIVIIFIVLLMQRFLIMPFLISGSSMFESYYDKEFIIVDRISYRFGEPERGDVIVFKPGVDKEKEYFLKRIIGVPGDTVKITDGKVYIKKAGAKDFVELKETYLSAKNQ